jgi:tetratricopeptide (TPR) repeat protein
MNTIFNKLLVPISVLFLWGLFLNIPAAFAQSTTLDEIDQLHKISESELEYKSIAAKIEKVLAVNPDLSEWQWRQARTHYTLAKISKETRHYDQCILYSSRAIELHPDSASSYFYRGLCLGKQGESKGVWASLGIIDPFKEDMEKAVSLDPTINHAGPHRALGSLYMELPFFLGGDMSKSISHLKEAVRLAPNFPENHLGLAKGQIEKNNSEEARESLHKLMQLTDNTQDEKFLSLRKEGKELLDDISP